MSQEKIQQLVGLAKYASQRAVRMRLCGNGDAACCRDRWYQQAATYVDQRKFYMEMARKAAGVQDRFIYRVCDEPLFMGRGSTCFVAATSLGEAVEIANAEHKDSPFIINDAQVARPGQVLQDYARRYRESKFMYWLQEE